VRFITRNQLDWTAKVRRLAEAIESLGLPPTIFDGEVVAFDERGVTDFQLLQNAFRDARHQREAYVIFDLLYSGGIDLRSRPLTERKAALARLRLPTDRGPLRLSEYIVGDGPKVFAEAKRLGLEGIVSKRRDSAYAGGRQTDWLKIKCQQRSEFVIGGFTEPGGSRHGFGALLLGLFDKKQRLKYAGRVGTGFSQRTIGELMAKFKPLERRTSPFVDGLPTGDTRGVHWLEPRLVAQIAFSNWTQERLLRHPSFQGLREDKPARQVHPEKPKPVPHEKGNGFRRSRGR
jgi:bifunctional non-homologous end joining protein LigD